MQRSDPPGQHLPPDEGSFGCDVGLTVGVRPRLQGGQRAGPAGALTIQGHSAQDGALASPTASARPAGEWSQTLCLRFSRAR